MTPPTSTPELERDQSPDDYQRKSYSLAMVLVPALTVVATIVALWVGWKPLLPILATAVGYPAFYRFVTRKEFSQCIIVMLLWAGALSMAVIAATMLIGPEIGDSIYNGTAYQQEMFDWIRTGEGKESTPSQFLPEHAWHFALFALLALATGGVAALVMGSALMAYMSYYVAMLIYSADDPTFAALLGWHPWSVLRVIGYITAAMVLAHLFFAKLRKQPVDRMAVRNFGLAALALLIADVLIKTALAPTWQQLLSELLPLG